MNTEIRPVTPDDYPQFARIMGEAYPGIGILNADARERYANGLEKALRDERRTLYAAFRDGTMIGVMCLHDFTMNVRGQLVPSGGVGSIAVDLAHKRKHVAKELMQFYIAHYRQQNANMLLLWPFRPDFYHQMGFGLGGPLYKYALKPDSFPRGDNDEVRYLTADDVPALAAFYNRLCETQPGMVIEPPSYWRIVMGRKDEPRFVGCFLDDELRGFLVYRFVRGNPQSFVDNHMEVSLFFADDPEAMSQLGGFIHTQADQINRVMLITHEPHWYHLVHDARNDTGNVFRPVCHESHTAGVGIMYRIADLKALINQLSDVTFGEVSVALGVNLTDSFVPDNAGVHTLRFDDGRVSCTENEKPEVTLGIDVADLSSLLMGAVSLDSLLRFNRASLSDAGFADRLNRLFAQSQLPATYADF